MVDFEKLYHEAEKLYHEAMEKLAKLQTEHEIVCCKMKKCSRCSSEEDKKKVLEKRKINTKKRQDKQKALEEEITELKIQNSKLVDDFDKVSFFFARPKKQSSKPYCDNCDLEMEIYDYKAVCFNCGACDESYFFWEDLQTNTPNNKPTVTSYNKHKYFINFLRKIQNISSFPLKQLRPTLDKMFEKKVFTSMTEIKNVIYDKKQTKRLLRYSIEIFFYLNDIQPIKMSREEVQRILDLYTKVITYEKVNRVRLSQSKSYFATEFFQRLMPDRLEKLQLLMIEKQFVGHRHEYEKCLKEILTL